MRRFIASLGVAAALLVSGALQAKPLTIGISQYPSTLHPAIDAMLAKSYVLGLSQRPFVAFDKDWKATCILCEALPTFENGGAVKVPVPKDVGTGSGEGVAVTFRIREGMAWADGVPVTVDDVVLAWEVGKHPKSGVTEQESYRRILEIRRINDRTFTLINDRVEYRYNLLALTPLPAHVERAPFEADPERYKNETRYVTAPDTPGLYNGPYRVTGVTAGAALTLERNPYWVGEAPAFERIIIRAITNTAALEANLRSGGIDYIAGELGLSIDQATALERRMLSRYRFSYRPGLIYEHIDVNLDHPALKDVRVRQALLYGANREAVSQALFGGRQPVADASVAPNDPAAAKDIQRYPYDVKRAAELLDEAGWLLDEDGKRWNAAGDPLAFDFMTTAGNRLRELAQQALQSDWAKLGVSVNLRNQPARVFFGKTVTKRKFNGLAMYSWLSSPETPPRTGLHSSMIPTADNGWSGQNYPGYRNAEVDGLLDKIEVELDQFKRYALWARLQQIYARDLPALPFYFRAQPFVIPLWLTGIEPTGHQYPTTLWVEGWRDGRK